MSDPGWYPPIEGAHWQPRAEDFPTSEVEPQPAPATAKGTGKRNWVVSPPGESGDFLI